jgi:5-hydroxyisourate hydrolase-like protein (transthyretin family)
MVTGGRLVASDRREAAMPESVTVVLLDLVYGRPAADVTVSLSGPADSGPVATAETDDAGSCTLALTSVGSSSSCQLTVDVDRYFSGLGIKPAFPDVTVTLRRPGRVVLYLAPFGHAVYVYRPAVSTADRSDRVTQDLIW